MLQDIRYAVRMLLKYPGFAATAVLVLALGIGANTAIFSVVNAVILRPLPYPHSEQILIVWEKSPLMETSVSYPNFLDWQNRNRVFDEMSASRRDNFNLTGSGEPERLQGRMVSANFFHLLGVTMFAGRGFTANEDRPNAPSVAVLSNEFWKRHFGSDKTIVGKQITLNDRSYTVIGITPSSFQFISATDVFVPIAPFNTERWGRDNHPGIWVLAKMKEGITIDQAKADMESIARGLEQQYPDTNAGHRVAMHTLFEDVTGDIRPAMRILLGAVFFVLLIACGNVANMLLARTTVRNREIATRISLGASPGRLIRQLLAESLLMSVIAGGIGLLLALWGIDLLVSLQPANIPRLSEVHVDTRVLLFTLGISLFTGLFFGIFPALYSSRLGWSEALKQTGRAASHLGSRRTRQILVIAELALSLILLFGSVLLMRSLIHVQEISPGFNPDNLLTMQLSLPATRYEGHPVLNYFQEVQSRVASLPGVKSVAYTNGLPIYGASEEIFSIGGRPVPRKGEAPEAVMYDVSPDYFKAMQIRLLSGRYINERDTQSTPLVAVIDRELASKHYPNQDPIGQKLVLGDVLKFQIVGIVEHVKHFGLDVAGPIQSQMYVAFNQIPNEYLVRVASRMTILIRTAGDPKSVSQAARAAILQIDRNQPVYEIQTMNEMMSDALSSRKFAASLLSIFAALALLIAAVGIYGVISFAVAQRTREIGIRMALGATRMQVLRMILDHGMRLTLFGLIIGFPSALMIGHLLTSLLFEVTPFDPPAFIFVSIILSAVGFIASFVPAQRATKVDPMVALRYE